MNNLISERKDLLNELGHVNEPGYATKEMFDYHRKMIKASKWRIKEWDYYCVIGKDYAFACTIADLGYLGMINVSYMDFNNKIETKKTKLVPFPFGKFNLPNTTEKLNSIYQKGDFDIQFLNQKEKRHLLIHVKNFKDNEDLVADLKLTKYKNDDRMMIVTPWVENKKAFYYNQKLNCMNVSGNVKIGEQTFKFDPKKDFGVLDWGRGVWTYKNTWYWASLSGLIEGKRFGFNLGYGFGDTSSASENMIFYDGKAHKLNEVQFELDSKDVMKPWKFTSDDGSLDLVMEPIFDRVDNMNLLIIKNLGHQVYGKFSGFVILEDGTKLVVDKIVGFAEVITNHY